MQMITVVEGDITKFEGDVIVNAANRYLKGGHGVDGAINKAAGPKLLEYTLSLGGCFPGDIRTSPSFDLKNCKTIYHAVGPMYRYYLPYEAEELLRSCYRKCLEQMLRDGYSSIAFPNISTGAYKFPKRKAGEIAVDEVKKFLKKHKLINIFVAFYCYDKENKDIYDELLDVIVR